MGLLIAIAMLEMIVIYIFNFKLMDQDYIINKLEIEKRLLLDENMYLIKMLEKRNINVRKTIEDTTRT